MHKGRALTLTVIPTGVQTPASALPSCVTLSKLPYISRPQFSRVWGGTENYSLQILTMIK